MKKNRGARLEDLKICAVCGRVIVGEFDYVRTRRGTEMYFHKNIECRRKQGERER